jgi:cytoskeletal protein CcmA (bactofilin family)
LPVISELGRPLTAVSEERASARSVGVGGSGSSFARHSTIGAGLSFTGTALLDGAITVAGEVRGDLQSRNVESGLVTITETGLVVGDIRARNISVLGKTQGTLDAPGGKVSLHDTASVSGRIRYAHLQVNGADLNAQLERVRSDDKGESQS